MKKQISLLSLICFLLACFQTINAQTILLGNGWKFNASDNQEFSKKDFDDSKWEAIKIDKAWEPQGHENYDGYAWYRIKILIPSTLKLHSELKDSIKICLGKIDDYDQSFLNGKILGVNGRNVAEDYKLDESFMKENPIPWNKVRNYIISTKDPRILWDKENVIAVRVYDQGGDGGMFSGGALIKTLNLSDYLICDNQKPFTFKGKEIGKTISLKNISGLYIIKGNFTIKATNNADNKTVYEKKFNVELKSNSAKEFSYSFNNNNQPGSIKYIFEYDQNKTKSEFSDQAPYILTPPVSAKPQINGAKVYGQRPNRPFLYTIAATGARPMTFDATNLPPGLTINKKTGIITGKASMKGDYKVTLIAKNKLGTANSVLRISIGDQICLTPPMGWNSWNAWGLAVDQNKVIASAKVYKEKGLMNHGWTYINIDDGWEIEGSLPAPKRDESGNILCNSKFPNMKALGDSIHALGLKFGIYSSPGHVTCGGYTASYLHELKDAQSYASWGIDYLKYDWCSYDKIAVNNSLAELKKPYIVMNDAFKKIDRDIVYSLCQYGMGDVWEWGSSVGGNLWRTTGDITDTWKSMSTIGFNQVANAKYAKPGNWNDPDMLVVGWVGWGPSLHPSRLTPDEQYTHISLWCLLSSPLLIGCDLTRLDEFTLNLLTNDEVLALDQDPLGKQATPKIKENEIQVWVKELEDGNKAIGIFNLGENINKYSLDLSKIGITANVKVRDLWRQKDLGSFKNKFEAVVPSHGVVLIKLFEK